MAYPSADYDAPSPVDLSLAWHAHAPPPPPGSTSPSTSKMQRRHSYNPPAVGQYVTQVDETLNSPESFVPPQRSRTPVGGGGHRAAASFNAGPVAGGLLQHQTQVYQAAPSLATHPVNDVYSHPQQQQYAAPPPPQAQYSGAYQQFPPQQQYQPQPQPQQGYTPQWGAPQGYATQSGYAQPSSYAGQAPPPNHYYAAAQPAPPQPAPIQTFIPPSVVAASVAPLPASPLVYRPQASPQLAASPLPATIPGGARPLPSPGGVIPPASTVESTPSLTPSGSVRRNLPQPPGTGSRPAPLPPTPARSQTLPGQPATISAAGGAGVAPPTSSIALPGLTRAQTVRNAAEALMAMGPPARRRARADIPSWSSSGDVQKETPGSPVKVNGVPAISESQSEPEVIARAHAKGAEEAAQSFAELDLGGSSKDVSTAHSTSRPVSPRPRLASQTDMLPPERPKSRGPRDDEVRSGVERRRSMVGPVNDVWPAQQVSPQPSIVRPQGRALPQVQPQQPQQQQQQQHCPQQHQQVSREPTHPQAPYVHSPSPTTQYNQPRTPTAPTASVVVPRPTSPARSPSISVDSATAPSAPNIAVSAPAIAVSAPQISVTPNGGGPRISVSGADDDEDDVGGPVIAVSGPEDDAPAPPTISMSHSGVPASPQRASSGMSRGGPLPEKGPASASSVGSGSSCAGCGKWTGGRVLQALGRTWHPSCFGCAHCSTPLEHVAFYEHEGRAYCHFDYHELFSTRCFHCRTPIVDERFIQIEDAQLGGKRAYHELHFFCANCGDPFLDPKAAGSAAGARPEMHLQQDEEGKVVAGGKAFVVHKGYPYCEGCHINLHYPRCKGCTKPIASSDILSALGSKWHPGCLVCETCKRPFEGGQMFVRGKKAWDEECYKVLLRNEL